MAEAKKKTPQYNSDFGSILDQILQSGSSIAAGSIQGGNAGKSGGGTGSALASLGINIDPSQIASGSAKGSAAAKPTAPPSLAQMLVGTSMDVTGRYGMTGKPYQGKLPLWAQSATGRAFASANPNDFDPYLGIVSQQGDERVYLGQGEMKVPSYWSEVDDHIKGLNSKDRKVRGKALAENQRLDTMDKVSRQLGEPTADQSVKGKKSIKGDKSATTTQIKNQPYLWDQDKVSAVIKKMRESGIPVKDFNDLMSTWGNMVDRASATYSLSQGKNKITPWDVLDMYKSEAKASGSFVDYQKQMNGTQTQVTKSVSELTEGQAWSALQNQLSQMLGRDPSDSELRDFAHRMNTLAAANPAITKTITKYKNGEAVGSTSHSSGGFTADDVMENAYNDAQNAPGYAEYQSASTYFNAALSALGAMGQG